MLLNEDDMKEPLLLDQSLYYIEQVLQGVAFLHQNSILHLDIKGWSRVRSLSHSFFFLFFPFFNFYPYYMQYMYAVFSSSILRFRVVITVNLVSF